jgi:hypothetical protein
MSRRRNFPFTGRLLLWMTGAGILIILGLSIWILITKHDLEDYRIAQFCQGSGECRQEISAPLVKSYLDYGFGVRDRRVTLSFPPNYYFQIQMPDSVKLASRIEFNENPVGKFEETLYYPSKFDMPIFPINPIGEYRMNVEVWRRHITILYTIHGAAPTIDHPFVRYDNAKSTLFTFVIGISIFEVILLIVTGNSFLKKKRKVLPEARQ